MARQGASDGTLDGVFADGGGKRFCLMALRTALAEMPSSLAAWLMVKTLGLAMVWFITQTGIQCVEKPAVFGGLLRLTSS